MRTGGSPTTDLLRRSTRAQQIERVGVTRHMGRFVVIAMLMATCRASGMTVTQVVDRANGSRAVVITVSASENHGFSLLDVSSRSEKDNILSHWNPTNHVIMINGGYFNDDFSPAGLCRVDGRAINSKQSESLSGFIGVNNAGKVDVLTQGEKTEPYPTVIQAGPFVIDPGGKIGIHSRSGVEAKRTLIGLTKDKDLVIVVTEPIFLFDLAGLIAERFPSIERLLNLDGGPSTALMTDSCRVVNQSPVRNYLMKVREPTTTP